jgi:hypothetical protein
MYLNNQNIMIYGSDEEKSLSLIGITSGSLEFADNAVTSYYLDFSSYKFKKLLFASKDGTDITVDGEYFDMTFNVNGTEFTQRIVSEAGPGSLQAVIIRQFAEYYPFNARGVTITGSVDGIGNELYLEYNFAFFA